MKRQTRNWKLLSFYLSFKNERESESVNNLEGDRERQQAKTEKWNLEYKRQIKRRKMKENRCRSKKREIWKERFRERTGKQKETENNEKNGANKRRKRKKKKENGIKKARWRKWK